MLISFLHTTNLDKFQSFDLERTNIHTNKIMNFLSTLHDPLLTFPGYSWFETSSSVREPTVPIQNLQIRNEPQLDLFCSGVASQNA